MSTSHARLPSIRIASAQASTVSELERLQQRIRLGPWLPLAFLSGAVLLFIAAGSIGDWSCSVLIVAAAYLPIHLWITRRVVGMPTMPMLAVAYIVFYALPFVSGNPIVAEYDFDEKLLASTTVAFVLVVSTLIWAILAGSGPPRLRQVRMIVPEVSAPIFTACLAAGCLFQLNSFLWFVNIPYEWFGVMRALLHNFGIVSTFALSFLMGAGSLGRRTGITYVALVTLFAASSVMSLYLIGAMEIAFLALFGLFLGSGRVPWKITALVFVLFSVLHAGKSAMREEYWSPDTGLTPPRNPVVTIREWIGYGLEGMTGSSAADDAPASLLDRASLMHMLLRTQREAPDRVPYLYGESYFGIPLLLVPRVLWPERPTTQEMLIRLNQHYGLLTRDEAATTSIGWGMLAEAYANFGFGGVFGLAVLLGAGLGLLQRWGGRYPMLSARAIATLITLVTLLRLETNLALFVTSLFQAMVPIAALAWFLMRERRVTI